MDSYVHGVGTRPLVYETVGALLTRVAHEHGTRTALVVRHQSIRWTYEALLARVDSCAAGLLAHGLQPGDRIGILSQNNAEWIVTQLATARAGLVLVNMNPAWREPELEYAIRNVDCKALIASPSFKSSNYIEMLDHLLPRLPGLETLIRIDQDFERVAQMGGSAELARLEALQHTLQSDDPINIQYTSGTTGRPKAATLTHHNIVNNALLVGDRMRLSADDRLCVPVPMYHCFGMVLGTLCALARGASIIVPAEWFDPAATLAAVAQERATALHGVPTMFIALLDHPARNQYDLGSLRTGIMAGAPCPIELMHRVIDEMHLSQLTIAYGMTETGPVSFQTDVDDSTERRAETVGRVLPHTEVKIVDDAGAVVPRGTPGELLTRGYCVMRGYWGDAARSAETIDVGRWLKSGDLATLDASGYCRIVGRIKDMVIRGGENIYPREIEEVLYEHPDVEQVEVFGVPDPKFGEEVCAWVKLRPGRIATSDELRAFAKGRLAHFKIPRFIELVTDFPMTVTGKVQKFKMKQTMTDRLRRPGCY